MRAPTFAALLVLVVLPINGSATAKKGPLDAKARKFLELTGVEEMKAQAIASMEQHVASLAGAPPDLAKRVREIAEKDDLAGRLAPIYMANLTEADLQAAIVFFASPAGKRFSAAQPKLMEGTAAAMEQWGREIVERAAKEK